MNMRASLHGGGCPGVPASSGCGTQSGAGMGAGLRGRINYHRTNRYRPPTVPADPGAVRVIAPTRGYPAFLAAFVNRTDGLAAPMAPRVLALAPNTGCRRWPDSPGGGRSAARGWPQTGGIDADAITAALRVPQLRQHPEVEQAFGWQAVVLLGLLDADCAAAHYRIEALRDPDRLTRPLRPLRPSTNRRATGGAARATSPVQPTLSASCTTALPT